MSAPAVRVIGLGKQYSVGIKQDATSTFYDALSTALARPFRTGRDAGAIANTEEASTFWALKDVSFDVQPGEVVGIIGRNGAGKSTLLKILSRITAPTEGRVEVRGRLASLLEVGTGFHPELSGRENIFLNGAILGMTRREIAKKFDEIVAFAEVEKFIDTPVKRYSSGMYVRLAFAVAAHLEPEVLIVDEVLAVGDADFQRKCLGKMKDVSNLGRSILFVSHNMPALRTLCSRAILLSAGCVQIDAPASETLAEYANATNSRRSERAWDVSIAPGDDCLCLERIVATTEYEGDRKFLVVRLQLVCRTDTEAYDLGILFKDAYGFDVFHSTPSLTHDNVRFVAGRNAVIFKVDGNYFRSGRYTLLVTASIPNRKFAFELDDVVTFDIENELRSSQTYGSSTWRGVVNPNLGSWHFDPGPITPHQT